MAYKQLKLWFDKELAEQLAHKIQEVAYSFDSDQFVHRVEQSLDSLELKDRVEKIADELYRGFSSDYQTGISHLMQILGPENDKETGMFLAYYWIMPIAKFVEKYGLQNFSLSMQAIEEITKRNTGEYAIRPFIEQDMDRTLNQMKEWSANPNRHIRRLASEGVRPRLPWAKKLDVFIKNPMPILPILENLKDDPSKYVQKSVANCLNDILKDNYAIGVERINSWDFKNAGPERKWIIKHALRNRIKAKDEWAMGVLG